MKGWCFHSEEIILCAADEPFCGAGLRQISIPDGFCRHFRAIVSECGNPWGKRQSCGIESWRKVLGYGKMRSPVMWRNSRDNYGADSALCDRSRVE